MKPVENHPQRLVREEAVHVFEEEFILIGQKMTDADGVVVMVGKPLLVNMREVSSRLYGDTVTLTINIRPGYTKVRARTFLEAVAMIVGQQ